MGDEIDGDGLGNKRGRPPNWMKAARRIEGSWDEGEVSERSHSIARLTTSPQGCDGGVERDPHVEPVIDLHPDPFSPTSTPSPPAIHTSPTKLEPSSDHSTTVKIGHSLVHTTIQPSFTRDTLTGRASLTLETYLGHGRVYDVYRGHLTCPPTVIIPIPCIAKFVDFDTFPPDSESNDDDPWVYSVYDAVRGVNTEQFLLSGPLKQLGGTVVPELYGSWRVQPGEKVGRWTVASEGAAVIVMQDGGESVGEELIREEQ